MIELTICQSAIHNVSLFTKLKLPFPNFKQWQLIKYYFCSSWQNKIKSGALLLNPITGVPVYFLSRSTLFYSKETEKRNSLVKKKEAIARKDHTLYTLVSCNNRFLICSFPNATISYCLSFRQLLSSQCKRLPQSKL